MITVGVVESLFGNITTQREGARLLLGIDRDDGRSETLVIRNDGNIPLTGDIGAMLFDDEGDERTDWSVDVSPDTVTNLGVGETLDVVITLMPKENVERGVGLLTINLSGSDEVITQLELEVSVSTAFGSGGLWDVLPEGANLAIAALLVVGLVAAGARMKRSGRLIDDGTELVSPNTHTDPDLLGQRRDEALDLGSSVDGDQDFEGVVRSRCLCRGDQTESHCFLLPGLQIDRWIGKANGPTIRCKTVVPFEGEVGVSSVFHKEFTVRKGIGDACIDAAVRWRREFNA